MAVKFSNNATSTLTAGITNSATSLTVASAASFPTLGVGDYTYVTIVDAGDSANFEIVKVTAISGSTFTITRAQQGTTAKAFSSGDAVSLRVTAGLIEEAIGEAIVDGSTGATLQDLQFLGGTGDQGTVSWNTDEETLDIIQNGAVLQVGQEIHYHVRNNTASTIPNGTPVMVTGTLGASGRLTVAPMDATDVANDMYYIGIATEDIAADTDGKVTHFGKIRGINTSAYSEGDVLWLSTSTVGAFTTTEPTSGIKIPAAIVISSGNNGTLFCRFQGSYGLHDLHDTAITSVADGQVLTWDATSSAWVNASLNPLNLKVTTSTNILSGGVERFDFDGNLNNTGTTAADSISFNAGSATYVSGHDGGASSALTLDSSNYLNILSGPTVSPNDTAWFVGVWYKSDGSTFPGNGCVFGTGYVSNLLFCMATVQNSSTASLSLADYTGGNWVRVVASTQPTWTDWNHYAIQRDGTDLYLFLNGSLVATGSASGDTYPDQWLLGRYTGVLAGYYDEWMFADSAIVSDVNAGFSVSGGTSTTSVIGKIEATGDTTNSLLKLSQYESGVLTEYQISDLVDIVNDTTPQLGGDLDLNGNNITGSGNIGVGTTSPTYALQIGDSSLTATPNGEFRLYGYDTSAATAKYGRLTIGTDGTFNIQAEDTYLVLNAANYIQSAKTHLFIQDVFQNNNKAFRQQDTGGSYRTTLVTDASNVVNVGQSSAGSTGELALHAAASEAVRVNSSGNVGIGTTTPSTTLDVNGVVTATGFDGPYIDNSSGDLSLKRAGTTQVAISATYLSGTTTGNFSIGHSKSVGQSATYSFIGSLTTGMGLPATDELGFDTAGSEAMRINSSGNVGIGVSSPAQPLVVSSSTNYQGILINGNAAPSLSFDKATGQTPEWKVGISGTNGNNFAISSGTANSDHLNVTPTGNVGIGTSSPSTELDVNGVVTVEGNTIDGSSTNFVLTNTDTTASVTDRFKFAYKDNNGTNDNYFAIDSAGQFKVGSVGLRFVCSGAQTTAIRTTGYQVKDSNQYLWSSDPNPLGAPDTGLARNAAGEVKITNGSTGTGDLVVGAVEATDLTLTGNLTVQGTTTTLNTATLDVEDKNITLNYSTGDSSGSANGAGITIQDAVNSTTDATLLWDATNDEWDFSHNVTAPNLNVSNWDTAFSWGNHASANYLTDIVNDTTPQLGGNLDTNGSDILFADNDKAVFGAGSDLQIYHDGSNSFIQDSGTGDLIVRASNNLYLQSYLGAENYLTAATNGAVTLYHDDSAKLATTSTGIDVTGEIVTTGGNSTNWNTAYGWGNHASAGYLTGITGQSIENLSDVTTMTPTDGQVLTWDNTNSYWYAADASGGGGISNVVEDTTPQLGGSLDTNGNSINFPDSSAGSNTLTFGTGSDMQIYHDGSNRIKAPSRLVIDTQDLDIYSSTGGTGVENLITASVNGPVKLYYDNNTKLETVSAGVEVSGRLTATTLRVAGIDYPSADGTSGQVLTTNGTGTLSFTTPASGISNVVEDTTPELGGHLAGGGYTITDVKYAEFNDYIEINTATNSEAIRINDSTGANIKWYNDAGTTAYGYIGATSNGVDIQSEGDIELYTGFTLTTSITSTNFSIFNGLDFSVQSDALFVDASSKEVGIGTTTPSSALDVVGTITATGGTSTNWNTAYDWGDHSTAGYLTSYTETDPIFSASAASGITSTNITNWNTAYGWGDHSTQGYLTGITGQSIENLSDVNAMTPTDGQVLTWDNANSRWDAADASGGGGGGTLDSVTDSGATTTNKITIGGLVVDGEIEEQTYSLTGTAIDPANGTIQYKTLSANTTFTESLAEGEYVTLMIDDGAGYTITWPTTYWPNGVAPTLSTTGWNVIQLWKANSILFGSFVSV